MDFKEDKLVWIGYLSLGIYNVFGISSVFERPLSLGFQDFYSDNFGTLTLLEFVIVASLFVNMILNFDNYKNKGQVVHLVLTAICLVFFLLKLVFYFMGLYKVM